jgi:ATP-dependent RNA helicase RhlE
MQSIETISNTKELRHFSKKTSRTSKFSSPKRNVSKEIDINQFVKTAKTPEHVIYTASRTINELPVHPAIITNLLKKGFDKPTEIQDKSLDAILKGRDLMGLAQTGTGKTAAFLVPLIHNLMDQKPGFQILIITPTRELAMQIEQEFKSISQGLRLFSLCLIGGTSVERDIDKLKRPAHIIIGTPGRLADMVRQRALPISLFTHLVLDEFDRLLDMGFSKEIQQLVGAMKARKQTMLFSATEDKNQQMLIKKMLKDPVEVKLNSGNTTGDFIDQEIIQPKFGEKKMDILIDMIKDTSFDKVIVFAETKHWVIKICRQLRTAGIRADEIHGNKSQNYRIKALESFKNRKIQVLVATDVAARGLDILDVTHVINFQQPKNMDSYIHRIGRTGRAGKTGKAYTFVS